MTSHLPLLGQVFPDRALLDWRFLSPALVYFDALAVPSIPLPMGEEEVTKSIDVVRRAPFAAPFDPSPALERYAELRRASKTVCELERQGIVIQSQPGTGFLGPDAESLLNLVGRINPAIADPVRLPTVAARADVWVSQVDGMTFPRGDGTESVLAQMTYVTEAVKRIVDAAANGRHLITDGLDDYLLLQEMIRLLPENPRVTSPVVVELVRFSVPVMSARSPADVVAIRERFRPSLERFRVELARVAAGLQTTDSTDLVAEAQRAFDSQVQPALVDLRRSLASPGREFIRQLIPDMKDVVLTSATVAMSVVVGLPLEVTALSGPLQHLLLAAGRTLHSISDQKWRNPLTFAILADNVSP